MAHKPFFIQGALELYWCMGDLNHVYSSHFYLLGMARTMFSPSPVETEINPTPPCGGVAFVLGGNKTSSPGRKNLCFDPLHKGSKGPRDKGVTKGARDQGKEGGGKGPKDKVVSTRPLSWPSPIDKRASCTHDKGSPGTNLVPKPPV